MKDAILVVDASVAELLALKAVVIVQNISSDFEAVPSQSPRWKWVLSLERQLGGLFQFKVGFFAFFSRVSFVSEND